MVTKHKKTKFFFYLIGTLLVLPFSFLWISHAQNDLLRQMFSYPINNDTIIDLWENVNTVWKNVFEWKGEIDIDTWWIKVKNSPSIIVKTIRLLLSLVIALSITMILYNWMQYIIQTWQWKEGKDLTKNIAFIVIWIIISLFSVVIITLLQSIPETLENELIDEYNSNESDNIILEEKWKAVNISRKKIWDAIKIF